MSSLNFTLNATPFSDCVMLNKSDLVGGQVCMAFSKSKWFLAIWERESQVLVN